MEQKLPQFSYHAKIRLEERFEEPLSVMLDDIKNHRQRVWLKPGWTYWVRGKLGIYIIDKNLNIITVYKDAKKMSSNINVINMCNLFSRYIKDPRDWIDRRLSNTLGV